MCGMNTYRPLVSADRIVKGIYIESVFWNFALEILLLYNVLPQRGGALRAWKAAREPDNCGGILRSCGNVQINGGSR